MLRAYHMGSHLTSGHRPNNQSDDIAYVGLLLPPMNRVFNLSMDYVKCNWLFYYSTLYDDSKSGCSRRNRHMPAWRKPCPDHRCCVHAALVNAAAGFLFKIWISKKRIFQFLNYSEKDFPKSNFPKNQISKSILQTLTSHYIRFV